MICCLYSRLSSGVGISIRCWLFGAMLTAFTVLGQFLCADSLSSWKPLVDFETILSAHQDEVNVLRNSVIGKNEGTIAFEKAEKARQNGERYIVEKRYSEAWELFDVAIKWYRKSSNGAIDPLYSREFLSCLERMKERLKNWENIKSELRVCLSDETAGKWFAELDRVKQSGVVTVERRSISIIWLLSLYSMLDYINLQACLCDNAIKEENFMEACNNFSKMFSDHVNYLRWKDSFEKYMSEWEELIKTRYLDKDIEQELMNFIKKRMDFLKNVSTFYFVRTPSPIYEEWVNSQIEKSKQIILKSNTKSK